MNLQLAAHQTIASLRSLARDTRRPLTSEEDPQVLLENLARKIEQIATVLDLALEAPARGDGSGDGTEHLWRQRP
ncbi:MAG: hypothetical protein HC828_03665 [Blastochloris sp.]|nr:hypothetical protein [Blastochloris sp.]